MAYMNQSKKSVIAAALKKALHGTGIKYTLSVRNHMSIVCRIKSAPIDFIGNYKKVRSSNSVRFASEARDLDSVTYIQVHHHYIAPSFDGEALKIINTIMECLNIGNWDRSDIQTDYFDVGHYVDLTIGDWDTPFEYIPEAKSVKPDAEKQKVCEDIIKLMAQYKISAADLFA